jgi:head-tail adaptor
LKNAHTNDDPGRLIARIVRTLLASEHFDSLADLTEALKCRCARLRIRWTNDDINAAYRLIASNTPLPGALSRRVRHVECEPDVTISRHEAAAILDRLGIIRL